MLLLKYILLLATACNYGEVHRNTYMPLVHAHTVRVHGCKAFVLGKKGTISHARHGAGAHVKESKVPAQGLLSTCAGMLAMHREIGSAPRSDCTRNWSVVDALHHQNIYTFWAQA